MLDHSAFTNLITCYPAFYQVQAQLQHRIRDEGVFFNISDEQTIFDVGSACRNFVMPVSGAIRVIKPAESGREILLYRLEPGDCCIVTLSCLLNNTPYIARAVAEGELSVTGIPKQLFIQLTKESEPFRTFIFQQFGFRLTQLMVLIEEITFKKLDQRLAMLLLEKGPSVQVTHQILAIELGSVREVISRLLHDFRDQGALYLERGRIEILDKTILAKISEANM